MIADPKGQAINISNIWKWDYILGRKRKKFKRSEFISTAKEIHGNRYTYTHVKYKGMLDKVQIGCRIHGEFDIIAKNHIHNKQGCPYCARIGGGFKANEPAILYYLRVDYQDQTFWKIGITNRTVIQRYKSRDLEMITILKQVKYEQGYLAREEEKRILETYKHYRYQGNDKILSSGNTELFEVDIFAL